jgi:hypothetical protein
MNSNIVTLSKKEIKLCKLIATARMKQSREANIYDRSASKLMQGKETLKWDLLGAYGEMALAKWLNIEYTAHVNTFHEERDVGPFEVRTASENHYNLILRDSDRDLKNKPFVLVVQKELGEYRIVGWIKGGDGFKDQYMDSFGISYRKPAFKVPQMKLTTDFSIFSNDLEKCSKPFKVILTSIVRSYRYELI